MIDKFIFYPRENHVLFKKDWKNFEISINVNEQKLQGWWFKAASLEASPFIIYYGGNAEDPLISLRYLIPDESQSYSWLFMNYRGFGESTGKPSQAGLFADALAVYDHVIKVFKISPDKIFLVGRSIGSSIASYVASQRVTAGLILVTPFDSLVSFAPKIVQNSPLKYYLQNYFNTQKYLESVPGQILIISAEEEEVIPKNCIDNLLNKFKNQLHVVEIKKADHQDIGEFPEYETAIHNYIQSSVLSNKKRL